jgi:pimeloyl-ACP methyl ester carboxylesterase
MLEPFPQGFAQRASALLPGSKVLAVDSGHFTPLSNPEMIARELRQFFAPGAMSAPTAGLSMVGAA